MRLPKPLLQPAILLCCLLFLSQVGMTQLKADFVADKVGGCSPVEITFTNTSTGTSANAVYKWDFGNGNTSILPNTSALFADEKTYTVTLTVTDAGKTSSQSKTVTVYKKPVVDFGVSVTKGCLPLTVTFTSNGTAGDGTIADYTWDYGDGIVTNSATNTSDHTFIVAGMQSPSLTVTNSYGCQSVFLKDSMVHVLPALNASFHPKDSFLCAINDSAFFINNSTGPGNLSYTWNFGDGSTSTGKQPFHVYNTPGAYAVALMVNSSEGCIASSLVNTTINVGNFKPDFNGIEPYCLYQSEVARNSSLPVPESSDWFIDNNFIRTTTGIDSVYFASDVLGTHTIKLVATYGKCKQTVEKIWAFSETPKLLGFLADILTPCGAPADVKFTDTLPGIVKNSWFFDDYTAITETALPSVTHNYMYDNSYNVTLEATNAAGCKAIVSQPVVIRKPWVIIKSVDVALNGSVQVCGIKPVSFYAESMDSIIAYNWQFGDGTTGAGANPVHTYQPGDYRVKLNYTLLNGCTGQVEFDGYVAVRKPITADFTISSTDVCGNNPVFFNALPTESNYVAYLWDFGDDTTSHFQYSYPPSVEHKYETAGTYTVSLLMTDFICADTMIKTQVIKISPPFPKITGYTTTCEGTRGEVTFTQSSRETDSWLWDFGDGQTQLYTTDQPAIKHVYNKTGFYKVVLTTRRGACTVGDSIYINVLLKQYPVLTGDKTSLCNWDEILQLTVSNLEKTPWYDYNGYGYSYYDWHYNDGTTFQPKTINDVWGELGQMPYTQYIKNLGLGKDSLALVVHGPNGCADSTNYIPLKMKGPDAYIQVISKPCTGGNTIFLKDSSTITNGVPIKTWEWGFAYMHPDTIITNNNEFPVAYNYPGEYPVLLKVTDAEGCVSYAYKLVDVSMNGLDASFTNSATTISPGSSVDFTNTTVTSDAGNTQYSWSMGDGSSETSTNVSHVYQQPGVYTVRLIAKNLLKGCIDTATTTIIVKYVNAAFAINSSFINSSKCPPVLVRLNNTSNNVSRIFWDFGDGTVAENVFDPAHIYTQPGKYIITLNTWSDNGTLYTTKDSVEIESTTASFKPDSYYGCNAKQITLEASSENITSFAWDFGDGLLSTTTDSFTTHLYNNAGVYNPQLMVTDVYGCNSLIKLDKPLVIDYLSVTLAPMQGSVCTPKEVFFNAAVISIAGNQSQQNLRYHWNFGTSNAGDTSSISNPSFLYSNPGNYPVSLSVQSAFGCEKQVNTVIAALQGLGASINGPVSICQGKTALFTGSTLLAGQPQWKWIFNNTEVVNEQNPPARLYNTAGSYSVQLIVSNQGCEDTISRTLLVNEQPLPQLNPKVAAICQGSAVNITVDGGVAYRWSPATGLNTNTGAGVVASPANDMEYTVTVTNAAGCENTAKVTVTVVHPFTLVVPANSTICNGNNVVLNVTGADSYRWINNTIGLSDTNSSSPVATPAVTSAYTVVGTDAQHCFSDTAVITVTILPLPTVNAGVNLLTSPGSEIALQPVYSNDVTSWSWTPDKYLNCYDCALPVVKPYENLLYTITVANAAGCIATDTVSVSLLCSDSRIYIPVAFSPNNDGINDRFIIKGQGIRIVNHLVVYDRYGHVIFERSDFKPGDTSAAWDGRYEGEYVPQGSYVYMAQMSCNDNTFTQKGSVIVIY